MKEIKVININTCIYFLIWAHPEVQLANNVLKSLNVKGAQTYCIINKVAPSGMVAMDHFCSLKAVYYKQASSHKTLPGLDTAILCKNSIG